MRGAVDWLHRGVRQKRNFVVSLDGLGGLSVGLLEISVIANDCSGSSDQFDHPLAKGLATFAGRSRLVPLDPQAFSGLQCCPSRIRDDGNTGARVVTATGARSFAKLMG